MTKITSANDMKNSKRFRANRRPKVVLAFLSVSFSLALHSEEQSGPKHPAPASGAAEALASAVEKQKAAVASMADALAQQRKSIQRQEGSIQVGGFFMLAPPQPLSETSRSPACPPLPESEVSSLIGRAAKNQDIDPDLLRNVMQQESAFRPCAVSPKGALGLMQLMPATASQLSVTNPFDPPSNVNAGAKLLKQLLDRYKGDVSLALAAYNAGPENVDAAKGVPNFPETVNYVNSILGVLSDVNSTRKTRQPGIWPSPLSPNGSFDGIDLGQQLTNALTH